MTPITKKRKPLVIPSTGPSITEEEVRLVTEAVRHGWYENRNMHIDQFVDSFSKYIGMKYCLPTVNCTSAIHLAMLALRIQPGDEVIVPDLTWVASAAPAQYLGADLVFVDVDPKNLCISPEAFERAITKRTKGVVVVDLLGNMPHMREIVSIARHHKIPIIEDVAEGLGATYEGKKAGQFGKISVFSFNATKLVVAGQGGMFATNDKKLFERAKKFAHHGMVKNIRSKLYWSYELGFNYNWTNMQAALGLAQLRRIDELVKKKRQIFSWYKERLGSMDGIELNHEAPEVFHTYWLINLFIDPSYRLTKRMLQKILMEQYQVDARPFFYPVSSMPPYKKYCRGKKMEKENPVSYRLSPYGISPPCGMNLTEENVDHVCTSLKKILETKRK